MKILIKILCAVLVLSSTAVFSGCGQDNSLVATTSSIEETTEDSKMNVSEQADLSKLHAINYEGDEFAGAWQIVDGEGSKFKSFVYVFDGNKKAYLVIGTTGYIENYEIEKNTDESGNAISTFSAELMFGINGTYTYEFSDDKSELVLTNIKIKRPPRSKSSLPFLMFPSPTPSPLLTKNCSARGRTKAANTITLTRAESCITFTA